MITAIFFAGFFLGLLVCFLIGYRGVNPPEEPPPGVEISREARFDWNYRINHERSMWGIGYLTRNSAIRAAKEELERIQKGIETQ